MQDFVGYMFFSFFEGIAVFALMFYLFRINLAKYISTVVLLDLFINLLSYFIRKELSLVSISPVFNLVICILLFSIFVKIPLVWSTVISLTGYLAFGLIQSTIVFFSFEELSIQQVQDVIWKAYVLQTITGIIGTAIGYTIYRFGYGFTFEFERLRFRWERIAVVSLIVVFFVALVIALVVKSIFSVVLFFAIGLVFFLFYSRWKDANE